MTNHSPILSSVRQRVPRPRDLKRGDKVVLTTSSGTQNTQTVRTVTHALRYAHEDLARVVVTYEEHVGVSCFIDAQSWDGALGTHDTPPIAYREESGVVLYEDPFFDSESQETRVAGERVFLVEDTPAARKGAEGVYYGRTRLGAFIGLDTPSGEPYKITVSFSAIRSLYR